MLIPLIFKEGKEIILISGPGEATGLSCSLAGSAKIKLNAALFSSSAIQFHGAPEHHIKHKVFLYT